MPHFPLRAVTAGAASARLDTRATNAAQAMRCKPYRENGRAVAGPHSSRSASSWTDCRIPSV